MTISSERDEWIFAGREELEELLDRFDLSAEDVCLVGSIALSARGLREHDDLDICIRSEKRNQVDSGAFDGFVTYVEERYANIDLSDDQLIEDDTYHDVIDGFKVVRPEIVFSYKKIRDLPKDERDVELLENYAYSTNDWNWDLYRADYSQRPNSLLSRGIQSLRTDGLLVTADKAIGLVMRKYPALQRTIARLPVFDLRTPYQTVLSHKRTLSAAQLLNRQYTGDEFVGLDIVAYWKALRAHKRGTTPNFDTDKLEVDIDTLANMGGSELEPITLTQRHRVLNPAHLARLLHDRTENIQTTFTFKRKQGGDETWLEECGLTEKERQIIIDSRIELLEEAGTLFYAMFWPLTHEYHDDMEKELREKVTVVDTIDIEVDDIESFVHDVYEAQTDSAPDWAVAWKGELMTEFPPVVRVAKVELPNPRIHEGISREMEMVKNDVRHAFVDKFEDKHYLSMLHATDSFRDNLKAKEVIESYR